MSGAQHRWAGFPLPASAGAPLRRSATRSLLLALTLVATAPVVRTFAITTRGRGLVVVVAVVLVAAMVRQRGPSRRPPAVWAVAGIALGAATWGGGRTVGVLTLLGAAASLAADRASDRAGNQGLGPPPAGPAVGLTIAAAWAARPVEATILPGVLAGAALVSALLSLVVPAALRDLDRAVRHGLRVAAAGVGHLLFGLLGTVAILVPWALDRLLLWDPIPPGSPGTGWVRRDPARPSTYRSWEEQRGLVPVHGWRRAHRTSARTVRTVVVVVAAVLVANGPVRAALDQTPSGNHDAVAMADAPWWPDLSRATEQLRPRMTLNSYLAYESPDVSSRYLNVRDGRRVTWQPPGPACGAVSVWMFGGSTTFGEGQRDDHTIPSELARVAWEHGITLDVANFGQLGDTAWIEARRLTAALAIEDAPPQLVTFYDGINEYEARRTLQEQGHGADAYAVSYVDSSFYSVVERWRDPIVDLLVPPRDIDVTQRPSRQVGPKELGELAGRQYADTVTSVRRMLDERGIEVVRFDQPTIYSQQDGADTEPRQDPAAMASASVAFDRYRAAFPPGIVSLTAVLDGLDGPVFIDSSHTNEHAARLVAEAMFAELEPTLRALDDERGPGCS